MKKQDPWETPMARAYKLLFNAITDAVELLEARRPNRALGLLRQAQQNAEDIIIRDEPLRFPGIEQDERG